MKTILLLRLGATQPGECIHCSDTPQISDPNEQNTIALFDILSRGRQSGAQEVVFLKGESAVRADFLRVVRRTRDLGYGSVEVQTNGKIFGNPGFAREALNAGMGAVEISIYGPTAEIHDEIAQSDGAFVQTTKGIQKLTMSGARCRVSIPVLEGNAAHLKGMLEYLDDLYVERVTLNMTPSCNEPGLPGQFSMTEETAETLVSKAVEHGKQLGMDIDVIKFAPVDLAGLSSDTHQQQSIPSAGEGNIPIDQVETNAMQYDPFPPPCPDCSSPNSPRDACAALCNVDA